MTTAETANERLKQILRAGKLFEGKYRIVRPLGAGSFAIVVHARHEVMERDVALKFLKPKMVEDNPEVSERFIKEVRIASRVKHPNLVTIFDFGETEDGIYYMVQEFVSGTTFDELLEQRGKLDQEEGLHVLGQILSCLGEAHANSIIHRDLKPSNLMVTERGDDPLFIKILDFGVAKVVEGDEESKSRSTKFIGTPIYMSPEQILGKGVQPSSDLYSIGLIFYELLTGQAPIQASAVAEVVQQHLSEDPFSFPMLNTIDPGLAQIILKATARHPQDRFQSAGDFLEAIGVGSVSAAPSIAATQPNPAVPALGFGAPVEGKDDPFTGQRYIGFMDEAEEPGFISSMGGGQPPLRNPVHPSPQGGMAGRSQSIPVAQSPPAGVLSNSPPASFEAPAPSFDGGDIELDLDAVRRTSGRGPGGLTSTMGGGGARPGGIAPQQPPRATGANRAIVAAPPAEPEVDALGMVFLYTIALLSVYVLFVLVSAMLPGQATPVRVGAGLGPLLISMLWVTVAGPSQRGVHLRWLVPIATRQLAFLLLVPVILGLAIPKVAAEALRDHGAWFIPKGSPVEALRMPTELLTNALAALYDILAPLLPWVS